MSNTFQEYGINATVNDLGELNLHVVDKTVGQDAAGEFIGFLLEQYGLTPEDRADADEHNNKAYKEGAGGAFTSSVPVEESTPAPAAPATREEIGSDGIRRDVPVDLTEVHVGTPMKRRPGRPRKTA